MEELGSSSGSSSRQSAAKRQNFMLHVLSPSVGFPNKITFPDVPISATVGELKIRIWKAVDSGPSPELQRLIYRGKPLVQDTALLKDVVTQEAIDRSESISLHLVLPPTFSSKSSISSAPSKSPQPETVQQPEKRLPSITGRRDHDSQQIPARNITHQEELSSPSPPPIAPGPPPPSTSTFHSHDNSSTNIPNNIANNIPSHLPPHVQQAMANHFRTLFQHFAPRFPIDGNANSLAYTSTPPQNYPAQSSPDHDQPAQPRSNHNQPAQQPNFQPLNFNQNIAPQQQVRTAAGFQSLGHPQFQQHMQSNSAPMPSFSPPGDTSASLGTSGKNRIVPQSSSSTSDHSTQETSTRPPDSVSSPQISTESPDRLPSGHLRSGRSQESLVEEKLSIIESALAASSSLHESVFETLRNQLQNLQTRTETSTETLTRLSAQLEALSGRAQQLRALVNDALAHVVSENGPAQRPRTPTPAATSNSTINHSVYLLSSPSGPYALLVSPSGLYTAPWQFPTFTGVNPDLNVNETSYQSPNVAGFASESRPPPGDNIQFPQTNPNLDRRTPQLSQPPPQPQSQMEQQQPPPPQPDQQEQANQFQDLARALVPMGGHIWLLIRLFGFVYFFTGGGGHVRTIVLGLCALIVFIAQSGVFRPFLQSIWEPFRRHMENLLPLAANDRIGQGANGGNNANGTQDRAAPGAEAAPTPHQAAERMLREHDRRDGSIVRQNLRRLERALALFVASLVPGVGERHIAARDAAEAARREEERLREENIRREEEEKERIRREQKGKGREDGGGNREPLTTSHGLDQVDTTRADGT